jgi:hypothetical protein
LNNCHNLPTIVFCSKPPKYRKVLAEWENNTCVLCLRKADSWNGRVRGKNHLSYSILTLDHIYPDQRKAGTHPYNLMILCTVCNVAKGDQNPEKWLEKLLPEERSRIEWRVERAKINLQNYIPQEYIGPNPKCPNYMFKARNHA